MTLFSIVMMAIYLKLYGGRVSLTIHLIMVTGLGGSSML
jgi:hypothetical protein